MGDLWSVVLGAGLTAIFGLIGLHVNHRREHRVWLRNERLEAYSSILADIERFRKEGEPFNEAKHTRMKIVAPAILNVTMDDTVEALRELAEIQDEPEAPETDALQKRIEAGFDKVLMHLTAIMRIDVGTEETLATLAAHWAYKLRKRKHRTSAQV